MISMCFSKLDINLNNYLCFTGYVVEKCEYDIDDMRWLKCNFGNVSACQYTITNLTDGNTYSFRVYAKNSAGSISKPSIPSEKVICKSNFKAPSLELDPNIRDTIVLKVDSSLHCETNLMPISYVFYYLGWRKYYNVCNSFWQS